MKNMKTQPVTKLNPGDVAPYCLLPGSPERAEWMTTFLDESKLVSNYRGLVGYKGVKDGIPISIISTGMGALSESFVAEECINLGAHTLIRVGSCGWIQTHIKTGDINIVTGAVRDDGLTDRLIPPSYPAIADISVVQALINAAEEINHPYHVGLCLTGAAWYGIDTSQFERIWRPANVNVFENEASALLVIASLRGVRAGAIVAVDDEAGSVSALNLQIEGAEMFKKGVEAEIKIAIKALVALGKDDLKKEKNE
jgi:uridine phosphorylase